MREITEPAIEARSSPKKPRKKKVKITDLTKRKFLKELSEFPNNFKRASERVGHREQAFHDLRKRDPEFAAACEAAVESCRGLAENELYKRGVYGNDKKVFYKGGECGTIKDYSDPCLLFYLKGNMPEKYGDRQQLEISNPDGSIRPVIMSSAGRAQLVDMIETWKKVDLMEKIEALEKAEKAQKRRDALKLEAAEEIIE